LSYKEWYQDKVKSLLRAYIFGLIDDQRIASETHRFIWDIAPSTFWHKPSSQSGKYHPVQDNGFGGAVRHSISCAKFANRRTMAGFRELVKIGKFDSKDKDCVIAACFIHDTWISHKKHSRKATNSFRNNSLLAPSMTIKICTGVENHMGLWGPVKIDFPVKDGHDFYIAYAVAHADLLVSRKDYRDKEMYRYYLLSKPLGDGKNG